MSKKSKSERKNDRIQALEKELASEKKKTDMFSSVIRWILFLVFMGFGIGLIAVLVSNWSSYGTGGVKNISILCVILIGLISTVIGVDIFKEKDRNILFLFFPHWLRLLR